MQYGCIGERLKHSFSAEIHAELADYKYEIREIEPEKLGEFLTCADFLGINVTIPYKEAVIPYLAEISEDAKKIGAVNTIVNRQGKLYGYNTDFYGMRALIERMGISLCGRKVAVLGTGGTSRTADAVASSLGASIVVRVGRRSKDGVITYEEFYEEHTDTEIIINTTPCGMYPYPDGNEERAGIPCDIDRFPKLSGVVDAVYNPLRTNLILAARAKGIPAEGGLYMLVAQAVRASEIFLDTEYPKDVCERVYKKILSGKENIVLCGMPTSGKSTVGKILSERLGCPLVDTDTLIVNEAGKPITEIFTEVGEKSFRDLESKVIATDASQRSGTVIATGGGAILKDENVNALRRNGVLVFLDRPLCDLLPSADRPLASSADAIKKRYEERYDRYLSISDVRIDIKTAPDGVADMILKELNLK